MPPGLLLEFGHWMNASVTILGVQLKWDSDTAGGVGGVCSLRLGDEGTVMEKFKENVQSRVSAASLSDNALSPSHRWIELPKWATILRCVCEKKALRLLEYTRRNSSHRLNWRDAALAMLLAALTGAVSPDCLLIRHDLFLAHSNCTTARTVSKMIWIL